MNTEAVRRRSVVAWALVALSAIEQLDYLQSGSHHVVIPSSLLPPQLNINSLIIGYTNALIDNMNYLIPTILFAIIEKECG